MRRESELPLRRVYFRQDDFVVWVTGFDVHADTGRRGHEAASLWIVQLALVVTYNRTLVSGPSVGQQVGLTDDQCVVRNLLNEALALSLLYVEVQRVRAEGQKGEIEEDRADDVLDHRVSRTRSAASVTDVCS